MAAEVLEVPGWHARWQVDKYLGTPTADSRAYETRHIDHNLLMYGGASCLWQCLIGNGTATPGLDLTFFDAANAFLGTGTSATAEAGTQTDLLAAGVRKGMEATYPLHTDGTAIGSASCTWKSSFGVAEANQAWSEVALFNAGTGARMLNRKVVSLGTKTGADTWVLTLTVTLA
jgi:hypothetical protein